MTPLRALLVDDHPLFRAGVRRVIESQDDFVVADEATSVAEALDHLEHSSYDLTVLDLSLPDGTGLDVLTWMGEHEVSSRVVMLSVHCSAEFVRTAFRLGASAFVTKGAAAGELLAALRAVADGGVYTDAEVTSLLLEPVTEPVQSALHVLTERERQVARVLSRGATTAELAEELGVSPKTVEAHRANIYRKLEVRNIAELTRIVTESERANPAS